MVQKVVTDRNSSREIELQPFIAYEEVEDRVRKAFSHLFGWNESGEKWIRIRCDASGRIITSVPGLATEWHHEKISATTSAGSTTLAQKYQSHLIKNVGTDTVYISFSGTATTNDFPLDPGESLAVDIDADTLYYIAASGTQTIHWVALR